MAVKMRYITFGFDKPRNGTGILEYVDDNGLIQERYDSKYIIIPRETEEICPFTMDIIENDYVICSKNHDMTYSEYLNYVRFFSKRTCPLCQANVVENIVYRKSDIQKSPKLI